MWRLKWLVMAVLLPILLVGGIVGGVVVAADDTSGNTEDQSQITVSTGDESESIDRYQALLDRVCAIYEENTGVAIDPEQLKDAFAQAQREMQREMQDEALERWLQELVDEGKITQEEADEYLTWWQSRPDVTLPGPEGFGFGGGMERGTGFIHGGGPCLAPDASD